MKKQIEITLPDLFNLQKPVREQILEIIRKEKRVTTTITAQKCKCTTRAALDNLKILVNDGLVKDLGAFRIKGKTTKVYEII